jgi:ketosteroid isomerase-like protein
LVQQEYRSLWTKKDGRFTVAPADQLYANNEHLTAFDTDLAVIRLAPDQSTRLQGYTAYRDIWPRIFEQVRGFEQSIGPVQIRINGNWAVTLFDGKGTFTTLDGKQIPTHKNFTLLWERHRDSWRIIHEHISDGR